MSSNSLDFKPVSSASVGSQESGDNIVSVSTETLEASSDHSAEALIKHDLFIDPESGSSSNQMADATQRSPSLQLPASSISGLLQGLLEHDMSDLNSLFELELDDSTRSIEFRDAIMALRNEIDQIVDQTSSPDPLVILAPVAVGATLTAGVVTWVLRSGLLLSVTISATPLWRPLDIVPILTHSQDDVDPWYEKETKGNVSSSVRVANDPDNQDSNNG